MRSERVVQADGVELASESFGDRRHPAILLIMGTMAMLWWPDGLCARAPDLHIALAHADATAPIH